MPRGVVETEATDGEFTRLRTDRVGRVDTASGRRPVGRSSTGIRRAQGFSRAHLIGEAIEKGHLGLRGGVGELRRLRADHAPDRVPSIVGDQDAAALTDRDTDRSPLRVLIVIEEAGQQEHRRSRRFARGERNEDHAVATTRNTIPGSMLRDNHAVIEARRQRCSARVGDSQRRRMWTERVVWNDRLVGEIGARRLYPLVDMRSVVAVRPPVKPMVMHRRHVVRRDISPELFAFVDRGPERAGFRHPCHPDGIAHTGREDAMTATHRIDLPDRCSIDFVIHSTLAPVAVRADGHIELRSIGVGDESTRPVVIDRSRREIDDFGWRRRDLGLARRVWEAHDGVRVRDVERIAHECHAEWGVQSLEKDRPCFGDTITIHVAKQRDAIGARIAGAAFVHEHPEKPAANPSAVIRPWRRVALRGQDISVRKDVEPARVIQVAREGVDDRSWRRDRVVLSRPADRFGDVDRWDRRCTRRRDCRIGAGNRRDGQAG